MKLVLKSNGSTKGQSGASSSPFGLERTVVSVAFHPLTCPYFVLPQAHVMPCNSCWCRMVVVEVAVVVVVFGSAVMVTMSQW